MKPILPVTHDQPGELLLTLTCNNVSLTSRGIVYNSSVRSVLLHTAE